MRTVVETVTIIVKAKVELSVPEGVIDGGSALAGLATPSSWAGSSLSRSSNLST